MSRSEFIRWCRKQLGGLRMKWIAEDNGESDSWYKVSELANNFNSLGSKQIKSLSKPKFVSNDGGSERTPKR